MAVKIFCDLCGKEAKTREQAQYVLPQMVQPSPDPQSATLMSVHFDLCQKCQKAISDFIDIMERESNDSL